MAASAIPASAADADTAENSQADPSSSGLKLRPSVEIAYGSESNYFLDTEDFAPVRVLRTRMRFDFENDEESEIHVKGDVHLNRDSLDGKSLDESEEAIDNVGGRVDWKFRMDDRTRAIAGISYDYDQYEDPDTRTITAYSGIEAERGPFRFSSRQSIEIYREMISQAAIIEDDLEDFDYNDLRGVARLAWQATESLAPFAEAEFGRIDYINNRPGLPFRDSRHYAAQLGFELAFGEKLTGELAARFESRRFDRESQANARFVSPVGSLSWKAASWLTLGAEYTRNYTDSSSEDYLLFDAREATLSAEIDLTNGIGAEFTARRLWQKRVPDFGRDMETEFAGRLSYKPKDTAEYYVSASHLNYRDLHDPSEDYSNVTVFSGAIFTLE